MNGAGLFWKVRDR